MYGLGIERPHQVSCGMEGTGIGSPAAKLIISVLARVETLTGHFIGTDVGERESTQWDASSSGISQDATVTIHAFFAMD